MKRVLVLMALAVGAAASAYVAGFWPERRARVACEQAAATTRERLERVEAENRLYRLSWRLAEIQSAVASRNFGDAQREASAFFDAVRTEAGRPDQERAREALLKILARRDALTIAITQGEAVAAEILNGAMSQLRASVGEPAARPLTSEGPASGTTPE